jgi:hypothetical protein
MVVIEGEMRMKSKYFRSAINIDFERNIPISCAEGKNIFGFGVHCITELSITHIHSPSLSLAFASELSPKSAAFCKRQPSSSGWRYSLNSRLHFHILHLCVCLCVHTFCWNRMVYELIISQCILLI